MIEKIILDYLSDELECPVLMEIPSNPASEFVVIEKTGSGSTNQINRATFAIMSYSDTLYKTALLNSNVIKAMIGDGTLTFGIVADTDISKCSLNSDYNATDTTNKRYRYQAVFDLIY